VSHVADRFTAILDANVLYPSLKRDVLLSFGEWGLYRPRWTDMIMAEWSKALLANRPDLEKSIPHVVEQMARAFPEALVEGFEALIDSLKLPDPDDRHVLAAAIKVGAHIIVTENKKDFPESILSPLDIEIQSADEFLLSTFELYPNEAEAAVKVMRRRHTNPAHTPDELLTKFTGEGLVRLATALKERIDTI